LNIIDVKVYNSGDTDVTGKFDVAIKDNVVTASANSLNDSGFYYETYRFDITASIKEKTDISAYWVENYNQTGTNVYCFKNRASIDIDGDTAESNEVVTITRPYNELVSEDQIVKSIVTGSGSGFEVYVLTNHTDAITFKGTFKVRNVELLSSILLTDILHETFSYNSMAVYDADGNDITGYGDVTLDAQTATFAFQSEYVDDIMGETLTWEIVVNYLEGSDLSELIDLKIPNVMTLTVNSEETKSNEVFVIPKPIDNHIKKGVQSNNGEYVNDLSIGNESRDIVFQGIFKVTNAMKLINVAVADILEAPFTYKELKVYNSNGDDITEQGLVSVNGQSVVFTFNENYLSTVFGQTFTVDLTAVYSGDANLIAYEDGKIPNVMQLIVNEESINSNEVIVKPDIKDSIIKSIINNNTLTESLLISNEDQEINFQGSLTVNNTTKISRVSIIDVLEAPFEYKELKVYDSDNNDVTERGIVTVDNQTVVFTFNEDYLSHVSGQTFNVVLTVNYDAAVSLSDYKDREIPNVMQLVANENINVSNRVKLSVKELDTSTESISIKNTQAPTAKTGDNINLISLVILMPMSVCAISFVVYKRKKVN